MVWVLPPGVVNCHCPVTRSRPNPFDRTEPKSLFLVGSLGRYLLVRLKSLHLGLRFGNRSTPLSVRTQDQDRVCDNNGT